MDALLNRIKSSTTSLRPHCELIPVMLPTVEINVNDVTESLDKLKKSRKLKMENKKLHEFGKETEAFENETRKLLDRIQRSTDNVSKSRQSGAVNVTHVTDNVFQAQMEIDSRSAYFQFRCDIESNKFCGLKSDPPVDSIRQIENVQDLEEIIVMMKAAFEEYFRNSTME